MEHFCFFVFCYYCLSCLGHGYLRKSRFNGDVSGAPIQWTNKAIALSVVLVLLVFAGLVQLIARVYSRNPSHLQQVVRITEENAERQHHILRTFSYIYMLELNLAYLFAAWHIVQTWFGHAPTDGFIYPELLFGLVIVTGLAQLALSFYKQSNRT